MKTSLVLTSLLLLAGWTTARKARNVEELSRCVMMAEPLVHNPEYVLPLTKQEIRNVCRMWGAFVDCVRSYTNHFLTPDQLEAFGEAIEPSMQSIHQLCAEDALYREAYLSYAPCMKTMYTSPDHCGTHYLYLADLVKGNTAAPEQLCCAHHKFRSCVLSETPRECGTIIPQTGSITQENAATHFVESMLDRALGFLLQQCTNYRPTTEECPGFDGFNGIDNTRGPSSTDYGSSSSPYQPSSSFTWTPPSNIYTVNNTSTSNTTPDPSKGNQVTELMQKNGIQTKTNYRRDFVNNRIDQPKSQQFRGEVDDAGASVDSPLVGLLILSAIFTGYHTLQ